MFRPNTPKINPKSTEALFLPARQNDKMTQTITGHSRLNFYLSSIGKSVNPVCACEKFIETVSHYLFRCEIESENRADTLIKSCFQEGIQFPPKPELLISNKTLFKSLQTFLNRSSRLDF